MKKILMTIVVVCLVMLSSCTKQEEFEEKTEAVKFKEDYESINGQENASGLIHRTVNISQDNPYVFSSASQIIEKIENKETFYLYIGDKQCPWCRSVIEKSIEVAKAYNIETIYYVNIWDDDHNEILRDTYALNEENKVELKKEGTQEYYKLLEYFDEVLSDYVLSDSEGKSYEVGEKRIYAPNFIYIEDGVAKKLIEGTSSLQTNSREELTEEMLDEEETLFKEFFEQE